MRIQTSLLLPAKSPNRFPFLMTLFQHMYPKICLQPPHTLSVRTAFPARLHKLAVVSTRCFHRIQVSTMTDGLSPYVLASKQLHLLEEGVLVQSPYHQILKSGTMASRLSRNGVFPSCSIRLCFIGILPSGSFERTTNTSRSSQSKIYEVRQSDTV